MFLMSYNVVLLRPNMSDITKSTIKIKNKTLAIEAAPAAIPKKPNTPAISAMIRKMTVQRNIIIGFKRLAITVYNKNACHNAAIAKNQCIQAFRC